MKTFDDLIKSYDDFQTPQCEILLGMPSASLSSLKALPRTDFPVLSVNVKQSIGGSSSAQITFACPYNAANSEFESNVYSTLEVGSKVAVKLGYAKPQVVFAGMLASVRTDFSLSGVSITITCYDAIMTLFHSVTWKSFKAQNNLKAVIEEVLKPCKKYGSVKVSEVKYDSAADSGKKRSWIQDNVNDYKYVMHLASLTNSSLYVKGDTTYFVPNVMEKPTAEVKLGWGTGLIDFSVEIDVSEQISAVEISYMKGNNETGHAVYKGSDIGGSGKLADDNGGVVAGRVQERTETLVDNEKQALLTAKNQFMNTAMNYVKGMGSTVGIPDIAAGSAIELTGLGKKLNGAYFLSQVVHKFDANGYLTNFTVQRSKI